MTQLFFEEATGCPWNFQFRLGRPILDPVEPHVRIEGDGAEVKGHVGLVVNVDAPGRQDREDAEDDAHDSIGSPSGNWKFQGHPVTFSGKPLRYLSDREPKHNRCPAAVEM